MISKKIIPDKPMVVSVTTHRNKARRVENLKIYRGKLENEASKVAKFLPMCKMANFDPTDFKFWLWA